MNGVAQLLVLVFYLTVIAFPKSTTTAAESCGPICRVKKFGKKHMSSLFSNKNESSDSEKPVAFRLYTGKSVVNPQLFMSYYRGIQVPVFDRSKPLKVVIHGWRGHSNCSFTRHMIAAISTNLNLNLITVDWSRSGSKSKLYTKAKKNVPGVAEKVAEFLDDLSHRHGVSLEQLHVIGHSLGAHVAGVAGRLVRYGKIGRITGLDPAKPLYSLKDEEKILGPDSAQFVDVIHTSVHYAGISAPIGDIDFYPNGGRVAQPGCGRDLMGRCSHQRSWKFYAESLGNPNVFPAISCSKWESFQEDDCEVVQKIVMMGEPTPPTARGLYFLATYSKSPFGMGFAGINSTVY